MSGEGLLEAGRAGRTLTVPDIIDMHGHLGAYQFAIPQRSADDLVAVMDRVGVRRIVCSPMSCISGRVEQGNREALAAARAHPGRILAYVTLWPTSAEAVEAETRRYLDEDGFVGVKLHDANGFAYDLPAYAPALQIANERRMPVLLHTWGKAEQFGQVRQFAERYPQASFLLGHSGSTNEDGYIQIARQTPNVYLELCGSVTRRGIVETLVEGAGVDKVVWGSDAYFLSLTHQIGKVLGARLCEADKIKVLSTNARAILGRRR